METRISTGGGYSITSERDTVEVPSNGPYRRFEPLASVTWTLTQPDGPTLVVTCRNLDPFTALLRGSLVKVGVENSLQNVQRR